MNKEEFFNECAKILGTEHNYVDLKPLKRYNRITGKMTQTGSAYTRWGPRIPGNGRFPGFGLIRVFGPTNIFVALHHPIAINQQFKNFDEVLEFLRNIVVDVD